jgi:hypothetical protein
VRICFLFILLRGKEGGREVGAYSGRSFINENLHNSLTRRAFSSSLTSSDSSLSVALERASVGNFEEGGGRERGDGYSKASSISICIFGRIISMR